MQDEVRAVAMGLIVQDLTAQGKEFECVLSAKWEVMTGFHAGE